MKQDEQRRYNRQAQALAGVDLRATDADTCRVSERQPDDRLGYRFGYWTTYFTDATRPVLTADRMVVPPALERRLAEMERELGDDERGRRIYIDRMSSLMRLTFAQACGADKFDLSAPPTDAEREFGASIGDALHQGNRLEDLALASGLSAERLVAIGKRTIRRRGWLRRIADL